MKGHFPGVSEVTDTVGGWLCLDFADTVDNYNAPTMDLIGDYAALVRWAHKHGILDDDESARLEPTGSKEIEKMFTVEATQKARELRRVIYEIFSALAHDRTPVPAYLRTLNESVNEGLRHAEIRATVDGFAWAWRHDYDLNCVWWPIARSAASLLTSPELKRLRQCNGHNCTFLFMDRSKNRSRRWCEMEVCGNRAKSRRHYARKAEGGEQSAT